jgi:type II secretory pathway component PulF
VTVGRFTRVVAIALGSGLDVMEAVTIAGKATGRPGFAIECALMADAMRRGQPLAEAMGDTRYIPSFAKRMIGAGKDSKEVASACQLVARHYEQESSNLSKNINTIIEPLLTVAMAGVVMLVALSVFLPMWQMARLNH